MIKLPEAFATALLLALPLAVSGEPIGEVDTAFKLIGPDHKIVVDAYDDPKVAGVTCYVSRAKTGGIKGAVGIAEDKAEASIACRQVGPVSFSGKPVALREEMFLAQVDQRDLAPRLQGEMDLAWRHARTSAGGASE